MQNTSDGLEGKSGQLVLFAKFEAVGAHVVCNFWFPLTMGRNKVALASGHPKACENRLCKKVAIWHIYRCDNAMP